MHRNPNTAPVVVVHKSTRQGLQLLNRDRFHWFDEAAAQGGLTALGVGHLTIWVVTDTDIAREILLTDAQSWVRPTNFRVSTRLAIGDNLFTLSDHDWRTIAPILSPYFRSSAFTARLDRASEIAAADIGQWPLREPFDLDEATSRLALRSAIWLLFGEELPIERANELVRHQRALMTWLGDRISRPSGVMPFSFGAPGRAMRAHRDAFDEFIREMIRTHTGTEHDDPLSALLRAEVNGRLLTEREICDHVAGLIGAGNEVTAATLSWALVYGQWDPPGFAALAEATNDRLRNWAMECIRLSSSAWSVTRAATRPVQFTTAGLQVHVRRGSPVVVYLRGMNRDPSVWPDASACHPDRFTNLSHGQRKSFMPFGLGERGCVGQQLALIELTSTLPLIAKLGAIAIDGTTEEEAMFATRVEGGLCGHFG